MNSCPDAGLDQDLAIDPFLTRMHCRVSLIAISGHAEGSTGCSFRCAGSGGEAVCSSSASVFEFTAERWLTGAAAVDRHRAPRRRPARRTAERTSRLTEGNRFFRNRAPSAGQPEFAGGSVVKNTGCGPRFETGSLTLLVLERETQAAALCDRNSPSGEAGHETKPAYVFSNRCGGFQPWRLRPPDTKISVTLRSYSELSRINLRV